MVGDNDAGAAGYAGVEVKWDEVKDAAFHICQTLLATAPNSLLPSAKTPWIFVCRDKILGSRQLPVHFARTEANASLD